ncbi:VOC family protein [Palleronia caenipelagi]|uniref:Ring-cleaving dioxygenase n=1 Tax=Palleronia caenipelagi TaxID=2489174 RepID=A0A547QAC6_9RHOB|nr:VOC family protein [Palleronia caenipelagi]TRD23276.1 ring-cleaving dioxygenase [Palleronia caenipelagi]
MLRQIQGLHHVTTIGSDPRAIDRFWTVDLGLRRVKKTVNFDAPDVYHLYYGDELGRPGTAMTYFPFPNAARGTRGTGEVSETRLAIPQGATGFWANRLGAEVSEDTFGAAVVRFEAPDGDAFAMVETDDPRAAYAAIVPADHAIRGFHSAALMLRDIGPTADLLRFMGYEDLERQGDTLRMHRPGGRAHIIDLIARPGVPEATQSAGSVHHIAFSVADIAAQAEVREALTAEGFAVTRSIDRDYFRAIYFRTPGGVLFEVATDEPGFAVDEDPAELGETLKLPSQHAHLRATLEATLPALN